LIAYPYGISKGGARDAYSRSTVLQVIRDRGKRGLLLEEDVYRQLYNPNLYLLAYSRIYKNDGALTQGVTKETAKLLQKQAGKYRWCELLFQDGDLIEIDHITPRSQGEEEKN
jgi:hypothetical protein